MQNIVKTFNEIKQDCDAKLSILLNNLLRKTNRKLNVLRCMLGCNELPKDGVTDATEALQADIDYAIMTNKGGVILPVGNYKVSSTITLDAVSKQNTSFKIEFLR